MRTLFLVVIFAAVLAWHTVQADEPPPREQSASAETSADGHEFEELGINRYTTPSIAQIFKQLDELKPLPFDRLKREPPQVSGASREQKGLMFGQLIGDGFLLVEAEKKSLIENFGRVLMQHARGLGVGDRVMRHSASLTDLGTRGEWPRMRQELITTQSDVEAAMIQLRDEKMAHLISLGGWLRGLEISAATVELDFSPQRAQVLARPDLANYFASELSTLSPVLAHTPLFEKLRAGIKALEPLLNKTTKSVSRSDVTALRVQASQLNNAIRQTE